MAKLTITSAKRNTAKRSVWNPALIFFVLAVLTIFMAVAMKLLVTGSIHSF